MGPHLEYIGHVCRPEVPQLLVKPFLLVVETGRGWAAGHDGRCDVVSNSTRQVGVDADQSRSRLDAHLIDDECTPIAALGGVALVSEALHELGPGTRDALGAPAGGGRLAGVAV